MREDLHPFVKYKKLVSFTCFKVLRSISTDMLPIKTNSIFRVGVFGNTKSQELSQDTTLESTTYRLRASGLAFHFPPGCRSLQSSPNSQQTIKGLRS